MAYSNRGPRSVRQRELEHLVKLALRASLAVRQLEQACFDSYVATTADYKLSLAAEKAVRQIGRAILRKAEL